MTKKPVLGEEEEYTKLLSLEDTLECLAVNYEHRNCSHDCSHRVDYQAAKGYLLKLLIRQPTNTNTKGIK